MCYYEKTILYCYGKIQEYIEESERMIRYKALTSYSVKESTMYQIEKIIDLIYAKNRLAELKEKLDGIFAKFSKDERECIDYKYYRIKPREDFDYTSRNYFRKQQRIIKKIGNLLAKKKMDEKWFCDNYLDIYFLRNIYERQKRKAEREEIYLKFKKYSVETIHEEKNKTEGGEILKKIA